MAGKGQQTTSEYWNHRFATSGRREPAPSGSRKDGWWVPHSISSSGSADHLNKAVTQAQLDYYKANYEQREKDFIGSILDGSYYKDVVPRAGDQAGMAYDKGVVAAERSLGRYGAGVTSHQRELLKNLRGHGRSLAVSGAQNDARDVIHDNRLDILSNLANVGRGTRTAASSGLSQAAGLQANREAVNRQISAQSGARRLQGAVTGGIGGYALGAQIGAIGGPAGAIGGAILGGLFS